MSVRPANTASIFDVLRAQLNGPVVLTLLLAALVVVSAMSVVWTAYQVRMSRAELESLEKERDELDNEFRQLRIAQAVLAEHGRIEDVAVAKLKMERVGANNERVVQDTRNITVEQDITQPE